MHILKYLLENAVGRAISKSWRVIGTELAKMGIRMSKKKFQTTVLKNSRKGPHFIGSWRKGYFVIDSYEDFLEMVRFYKSRMRQEESNLNKLLELQGVTGVNPEGVMLSLPDHMNNLRCCDSCRSRHSLAARPEPDSGDPTRPNRRRSCVPRLHPRPQYPGGIPSRVTDLGI
ncbi:MAG: hypothetical protein J0M04_19580 [Verrucomicrobia bacterium]|nr:hypothetical protein [Verrucomicrobiota bacterium]